MQTIKVTKVENSPTQNGGMLYKIEDDKQGHFSGFCKELHEVVIGDILEAEIEVKGRFNNITKVLKIEHDPQHSESNTGRTPGTSVPGPTAPVTEATIRKAETDAKFRMCALELAVKEVADPADQAKRAETYLAWLRKSNVKP
jgi:hypothetical protein